MPVEITTAEPAGVLTGSHYLDGDHAVAEGALSAGCRFVAGYPITPSTEVVERISGRFPRIEGGVFIQMEDEIASSIAVIGGAFAGKKSMTVTSGPGFSLMMEHVGLAAILEAPMVLINVQRGGPSTGLPTLTSQGDMMQARFGSHGDYRLISMSPNSPQECYDLTIKCFNLSEKYRCPVFLMMDECVGHMLERVDIPEPGEIEVWNRAYTDKKPGEYWPYEVEEGEIVPDFAKAGDGYRYHITGLTHDHRGYPVMTADCHAEMQKHLIGKIDDNRDDIVDIEEDQLDDADVVLISYGITSRVSVKAILAARAKGIKVGHMRLRIVWPFPDRRLQELAPKIKKFVLPELNMGQVSLEAQRLVGLEKVISVPHAGGTVHDPAVILAAIEEANR
jgi:2-oxoglutarate/2-oxoacid ferredoxin oxidoreductase subunit alpha